MTEIFWYLASNLTLVIIAGILIYYSIRKSNYTAILVAILGVIIAQITKMLIEIVYYVDRPNGDTFEGSSFFSMHTATAFIITYSIFKVTKSTRIRIFAVVLSIIIAISRVVRGKHYVVDILSGFLVATALYFIDRIFEK